MSDLRLAAAAWPLERLSRTAWRAKLDTWIATAEADLLILPEYAGMEPVLSDPPPHDRPQDWVDLAAARADEIVEMHREAATRSGRHILMGSLPVATDAGIVNRAHLLAPDGTMAWQDKQVPTPWERAETTIAPGSPLSVAETAIGPVATLICHDAEFPALARAQDAPVLAIPACTDGSHGAARVRNAARARALEGTCVTLLAQTLGDVPGCSFLDRNRGRAGIYAPPDRGMPEDGILAETSPDRAGWARAELPADALAALRAGHGEVSIPRDWSGADIRAALRR